MRRRDLQRAEPCVFDAGHAEKVFAPKGLGRSAQGERAQRATPQVTGRPRPWHAESVRPRAAKRTRTRADPDGVATICPKQAAARFQRARSPAIAMPRASLAALARPGLT